MIIFLETAYSFEVSISPLFLKFFLPGLLSTYYYCVVKSLAMRNMVVRIMNMNLLYFIDWSKVDWRRVIKYFMILLYHNLKHFDSIIKFMDFDGISKSEQEFIEAYCSYLNWLYFGIKMGSSWILFDLKSFSLFVLFQFS